MILADLIERAYKYNGVITAYVYGDFGYGKTSYALWTAHKVLGSWDKVLNYLFFDPKDAIKMMEKAIKCGERMKVIIMDDAGLWLDRLTWWEKDKVEFMNFFNLIRSVSAGVIFTTPTQELPKQIIRKCMFRVNVRPSNEEEIINVLGSEGLNDLKNTVRKYGLKEMFNVAIGYKLKTLPSFNELVRKEFYDFYPLHYPIHEDYEEKRRKALRKYFELWKESVEGGENVGRGEAYTLAKELLKMGKSREEIVKELMKLGIPKATSYRWLNKLMNTL